jgi:hypothetical protein
MPDPSSPLVAEAFEATGGGNNGYDESGWTEDTGAGSTTDQDYTGTVLHGTQSLRLVAAGGEQSRIYKDFTGGNERWAYFLFRLVTFPAVGNWSIMSFWDSGFGVPLELLLNSGGTLTVQSGTGNATTVSTMAAGNTYHVWIHYNNTSNTADVGFSTDGVRPTGGNAFAQTASSSASTDGSKIVIGGGTSDATHEGVFDRVFVDDEQIGDMTAGGGGSRRPSTRTLTGVGR